VAFTAVTAQFSSSLGGSCRSRGEGRVASRAFRMATAVEIYNLEEPGRPEGVSVYSGAVVVSRWWPCRHYLAQCKIPLPTQLGKPRAASRNGERRSCETGTGHVPPFCRDCARLAEGEWTLWVAQRGSRRLGSAGGERALWQQPPLVRCSSTLPPRQAMPSLAEFLGV